MNILKLSEAYLGVRWDVTDGTKVHYILCFCTYEIKQRIPLTFYKNRPQRIFAWIQNLWGKIKDSENSS